MRNTAVIAGFCVGIGVMVGVALVRGFGTPIAVLLAFIALAYVILDALRERA